MEDCLDAEGLRLLQPVARHARDSIVKRFFNIFSTKKAKGKMVECLIFNVLRRMVLFFIQPMSRKKGILARLN